VLLQRFHHQVQELVLLQQLLRMYASATSAATFTFNRASSSITATGTTSYTYSGSSQGPSTSSVTGSTESGLPLLLLREPESTTYGSPAPTKPTNVGTYSARCDCRS
jgi:hypothetical protein